MYNTVLQDVNFFNLLKQVNNNIIAKEAKAALRSSVPSVPLLGVGVELVCGPVSHHTVDIHILQGRVGVGVVHTA